MKKLVVLFAIVAACVDTCFAGPEPQKRKPDVTYDAPDAVIAPDDPIDDVPEKIAYLNQNWDKTQREEFYTLTQGSRLIPYDWFLHLEQANSEKPFRDASNMNRYRYLPQKTSEKNPHGLPIGFVRDPKDAGEAADWLGFTCAACHTTHILHKKVAYRIDGAPAMADHDQFLIDMTEAMRATVMNNAKFKRFAGNVLPNADAAAVKTLQAELEKFTQVRESYNARNKSDVRYGHARLDAFGRIMNEVMTRHIGLGNDNARSPNAPVSYPHLWDTPRYDRVQWNGIAENTKLFGPLGRNVGEVLGVFGSLTVPDNTKDPRFKSSVNLKNLRTLEESITDLWSPLWPDAFGKLDADKVKSGKKLFMKYCVECHQNNIDPEDSYRAYKASLHPLEKIGTDPRMADNFVKREGSTGRLKGRKFFDPPSDIVEIGESENAGRLILALVNGAILGADRADRIAIFEETVEHIARKKFNWRELVKRAMKLAELRTLANSPGAEEKLNSELLKMVGAIYGDDKGNSPPSYKAGSLNGVWATAPYLHNGSVPNLWELLLPPAKRSAKFEVGSREFDPKLVGFKSNGYPSRDRYEFDTTIDGNRNTGHTYHADVLTDDDRWALIEYMKSL